MLSQRSHLPNPLAERRAHSAVLVFGRDRMLRTRLAQELAETIGTDHLAAQAVTEPCAEVGERVDLDGSATALARSLDEALERHDTNAPRTLVIDVDERLRPLDIVGLFTRHDPLADAQPARAMNPDAAEAPDARVELARIITVTTPAAVARAIADEDYLPVTGHHGDALHAQAVIAVNQLEGADHLVLLRSASGSRSEASAPASADGPRRSEHLLQGLAPLATVDAATSLPDALHRIHTQLGHGSLHAAHPGWALGLSGEILEPKRDDVDTIRVTIERPIHPNRLVRFLNRRLETGELGHVARSSGMCRLASRSPRLAHWDHVGSMIAFEPIDHDAFDGELVGLDLTLIGIDLDEDGIRAGLAETALSDAEFLAGEVLWQHLADPLPEWEHSPDDVH